MNEPEHAPVDDRIRFSSDSDILEILEENTRPGTVSENYRRYLERKYGGKNRSGIENPGEPAE